MSVENTRDSGVVALRRALVVDESPLRRHGLATILDDRGTEPVAQAASSTDARDLLRSTLVDLLVVGVPSDASGVDLVQWSSEHAVAARVLALVPRLEPDELRRLLSAGPAAVLTLHAEVGAVVDALDRIVRGERVVAPALLGVLLGSLSASPAADNPLTSREMVVLGHLAAERSNREIAEEMVVSVATVKTHLSHIYDKLGVTDRRQAVGRGIELGLLA